MTGGSRGIGAATALGLVHAGWDVAISYRERAEEADTVVAGCRDAGRRAVAVRCDVADPASIEPMFEQVERELGPITAVVNNAGVVSPAAKVADYDAARLERVLAINVTGAFLVAGAAVRRMSTDRGGSGGVIVNVSIWGHRASLDMQQLVLKEIDLRGTIAYVSDHPATIELVRSGKVDLEPFITHRIGLEELVDVGYDTLINHNETAVKILVHP